MVVGVDMKNKRLILRIGIYLIAVFVVGRQDPFILIGIGLFMLGDYIEIDYKFKDLMNDVNLFYRIIENSKKMPEKIENLENSLRALGNNKKGNN